MTALFIGRFQPFHKGHLSAIKWILKKEGNVFIIIGSNQSFPTKENPFRFKERNKMIGETLVKENIKNFKIFRMHDYKEDVFWAKKVFKITKANPQNIKIFTMNPWTKKCFEKIGIKTESHPIFCNKLCGTKIRKKIKNDEKWENLVPKSVFSLLKEINCEKRIKLLT
jgi:nicotinamide-nucleotide adenylyltransferase